MLCLDGIQKQMFRFPNYERKTTGSHDILEPFVIQISTDNNCQARIFICFFTVFQT